MDHQESNVSRRKFIGTMAATGALFLACGKVSKKSVSPVAVPPLLERAPDGPVLKAGLIGCGGRGTGAALNFLDAGPNLKIVALADVFRDRLEKARKQIQDKGGQSIPDSRCFTGFDAYKKLLDTDVDVVLMATPPHFRPMQFAAAVEAGKHVFMEKPVAVDPVGARSIMETAAKAKTKGLSVVTGTQRRHQREYVETYKRIRDGAIGDIVAARCYWNGGQLWYRKRQPGWSDMEYMIRDWVNWCWLSGDHIVEQHVHNIDVINWFTGDHPVKAVGFGGRARRVTGDQYDFFSVDFSFENGVHLHSMCRQIDGCANNISEFLVGTKGSTNCRNTIYRKDGSIAWKFEGKNNLPYVQEHIHLVSSIRTGEPVNYAVETAVSTLVAIMGRISAYTGKETTWQEMMDSDLRLGPTTYALGPVPIKAVVPVPGTPGKKR